MEFHVTIFGFVYALSLVSFRKSLILTVTLLIVCLLLSISHLLGLGRIQAHHAYLVHWAVDALARLIYMLFAVPILAVRSRPLCHLGVAIHSILSRSITWFMSLYLISQLCLCK